MFISRSAKIEAAVIRDAAPQKQKLLDRAFAFAFRGLVYAQIWEDPVVDMEALAIQPDNRIATIASGGCSRCCAAGLTAVRTGAQRPRCG